MKAELYLSDYYKPPRNQTLSLFRRSIFTYHKFVGSFEDLISGQQSLSRRATRVNR
jgi:hypothetical protein